MGLGDWLKKLMGGSGESDMTMEDEAGQVTDQAAATTNMPDMQDQPQSEMPEESSNEASQG